MARTPEGLTDYEAPEQTWVDNTKEVIVSPLVYNVRFAMLFNNTTRLMLKGISLNLVAHLLTGIFLRRV